MVAIIPEGFEVQIVLPTIRLVLCKDYLSTEIRRTSKCCCQFI